MPKSKSFALKTPFSFSSTIVLSGFKSRELAENDRAGKKFGLLGGYFEILGDILAFGVHLRLV